MLAYYWCIKACVDILDHPHARSIKAWGMPPPPLTPIDVSWHAKMFQTPLPQEMSALGTVATHCCGMCS